MRDSSLNPTAPDFLPPQHPPNGLVSANIPINAKNTLPHQYNILLTGHMVKVALPPNAATEDPARGKNEPMIVFDGFPLHLLNHVSSTISTALKHHPSPTPTGLIIHIDPSIPPAATREVLIWLLHCASAGHCLPGPAYELEEYAFYKYGCMLQVVNFLIGFDYGNPGLLGELCRELRYRLARIAQGQVRSQDVIEM